MPRRTMYGVARGVEPGQSGVDSRLMAICIGTCAESRAGS